MNASTYAIIVAAAIFLGISAIAVFLIVVFDAQAARRLQRRLGFGGVEEESFGADGRVLQGMARRGQKLERFVDKEGETGRLLAQAGWRDAQSRLLFYAFQGILPLVLAAAVFFGWAFVGGKYFESPYLFMWIFVAFALSFLVPRRVLRSAAVSRQGKIKREVPMFTHLLVLLFEAGLSTRQALSTLVREGAGVLPQLGKEFESVVRQLEGGADTGETLRELGEVMAVEDLTNILSVLRQVDRYGGEVREPLLDLLKLLEERRSLEMRERVNILSGRMTVVMVLFFFPALVIFCVGPAVASILRGLGAVAAQ